MIITYSSEGTTIVDEVFPAYSAQAKKWGYINRKGKYAIEPRFLHAKPFEDDLALVQEADGRIGYIDWDGSLMVVPEVQEHELALWFGPFSEGMARVCVEGSWGFIDKSGAFVIAPRYISCDNFSEALAAVESPSTDAPETDNQSWEADEQEPLIGYIDKKGRRQTESEFHTALPFSEGIASVRKRNQSNSRLFGYINREGNTEIPHNYVLGGVFSLGLALAVEPESSLLGYIDHSGEFVINPQFHGGATFSDGYSGVADKKGKWGYIDYEGKMAIPHRFYIPGDFDNGIAPVCNKKNRWGYIDFDGAWVTFPCLSRAAKFNAGMGLAVKDQECCYIDESGRIVWKAENTPFFKIRDPELLASWNPPGLGSRRPITDMYSLIKNPFLCRFPKKQGK